MVVLLAVENPVSALDRGYGFFGKTAASESDGIDRADFGRVSVGDHERRHILHDFRTATGDGVFSDAAELMHGGKPAHDGIVPDRDMASESSVVREYDVVTHSAVVRDVAVGKEVPVAPDEGAPLRSSAAIHGAKFPEGIARSDF